MKQITLLFALAFSFASCSKESLRGSGDTITATRDVSTFSKVEIEGSADMEIIPGNDLRVEVTGYRNLLSDYETVVKGGTLTCRFERDVINVRNSNIRVRIYAPDLEKVTLHGSGEITVLGNGDLGLTGAEINGSGNISISQPEASSRDYKINGSGKIKARDAAGKNVRAEINGSGDIETTATSVLDAHINGSGKINYWGDARVTTNVSGSGEVRSH